MPFSSSVCVFYSFAPPHRQIRFLLGMEGITINGNANKQYEGGKWGGFGGKKEEHETFYEALAREMYEETAGCVCSLSEFLHIFRTQQYSLCVCKQYKKGPFYCFFLEIPYRDYPRAFYLSKQFCQYTRAANVHCIEKTHLAWFRYDEIVAAAATTSNFHSRTPQFRHKLKETFDLLQCNPAIRESLLARTTAKAMCIGGNPPLPSNDIVVEITPTKIPFLILKEEKRENTDVPPTSLLSILTT
jgi:8-oxo-dGTP pyrophosphatase MutT (NUDIX family)